MMMKYTLLLIALIGFTYCQQGEKLSFTSPELTEEEQHSTHMPDNLRCDACTAVAFQMTKALKKAEAKFKGKKLKESDYIDLFENTCGDKTWENYGLKAVDGVNRLSGEGLDASDVPGMMYGGGKWPGRLMNKCFEIVGDAGEDELYDKYRQSNNLSKFLCKEYSNDCIVKEKKKEL